MQASLFENIQPIEARQPALRQADVMRSAFLETHKWQEFHETGKLWIDGEIAVVPELSKGLYDYRTGFKGFEGKPVCRIGVWTKYFDNGQIAWKLDFGDGMFDSKAFCLLCRVAGDVLAALFSYHT